MRTEAADLVPDLVPFNVRAARRVPKACAQLPREGRAHVGEGKMPARARAIARASPRRFSRAFSTVS